MSTITIFSYILIFSVMITNVFKKLNKFNSIYLIIGIVFSYIGTSLYFTDIQQHESFMGIIILTLQLMYNIFLIKESKNDKSNLYIYVGAFLLPLYLINTQRCWDQVIIITLIEIIRIVSSSDRSKKQARSNLLNYISANLKIFILTLSTLIAVTITKTDIFSASRNIQELYVGIPIVLFYILSFVYSGGLNSTVVENYNINNLKSKNILSYITIYKIIIPFVIITNSKKLILKSSYDVFIIVNEVAIVTTIMMAIYFSWLYIKSSSRNIKLTAVQSVTLLPMSFMYLTNDLIGSKEYLLYMILNSFLFAFLVLVEKYQVRFKNISLWISKLMLFNSPVSPLLIINLYYLEKSKLVFGDFISLILFIIMIIPSIWLVNDLKEQSIAKIKRYNVHANARLIFMVLGTVIVIMSSNL